MKSFEELTWRGWGIVRVGWNFRPDWDKSLAQPWCGKWWVWLGPYVIGNFDSWGEP